MAKLYKKTDLGLSLQNASVLTPETRAAIRSYVAANSGPNSVSVPVSRIRDYGLASFFPRTSPMTALDGS